MIKRLTPQQARIHLESLCGRAERCRHELMQKLARWGVPSAEANAMLDDMHAQRWFDDRRFARAFVSDKVRFERRGRLYLRNALRLKHIPDDAISAAFAEIDPDMYADNLAYTLQSKLRPHPELLETFEGRTRLFRQLITRGYEPDLIKSAIIKAMSQDRDSD